MKPQLCHLDKCCLGMECVVGDRKCFVYLSMLDIEVLGVGGLQIESSELEFKNR